MVWLFVIGLGIWTLVIQVRLAAAERRLRELSRREATERRAAPRERVRGQSITPDPDEPRPAPIGRPAVSASPTPAAPSPWVEPAAASPSAPEPARPEPRAPTRPRPSVGGAATWLSENGLAWLGGGALALGGSLLAAYAAQQGWFTPALRIAAAIVLGLGMLAAGERIRRRAPGPGGHALAAAMASAAGAVTLYAAIWAAYALYHFLGLAPAAVLLAAISIGLLALAALHGEPLGLLAMLGAFLAPWVCALPNWNGVALDLYLALIIATGLATTARRGWGRVGVMTLAGAAGWILARAGAGDTQGAGGLLVATPALALLGTAIRDDAAADSPPLVGRLPLVALGGASLLWTLLALASPTHPALAPALVGAALALLSAAAIRQNLATPWILAAPAAGLALIALSRREPPPPGVATLWAASPLWLTAPVAALAGGGLASGALARGSPEGKRGRERAAIIAAAGGALALTLLRAPFAQAASLGGGSGLFILASALFLAGAALIARAAPNRAEDLALGAWIGAGAQAMGLAIHSGLAGKPEPLAYGLLALVLALARRRLAWRGLAEAAALAALFSLIAVLGPRIAGEALTGRLSWTDLAWTGVLALALQAGAWRALAGSGAPETAREAVSTSAVITGLITLFLALRRLGEAHGAAPAMLDPFAEAALRTVLMLAAGLALSVRGGPSMLSRTRGPVILTLGALHGAVFGGLILNPWWGVAGWGLFGGAPAPATLAGPPLLDALALAYLAPALLLGAAARRGAARESRTALAIGAAALGAMAMWIVMEIRRLFHGAHLVTGPFSHAEVVAYGAGLLGLAWIVTAVSERAISASWPAVERAAKAARWVAVAGSAWLACLVASPWWGAVAGPLTAPALFFGLLVLVIVLTALFARRGAAGGEPLLGQAVRAAAILETFALITLAIRLAFHGGAMRVSLGENSVETWTYSAVWALFGLTVLLASARARDRALRWLGLAVLLGTTAKVFLFDMATLEGVIRAASFLALGALLLIGALAARRLSGQASPGSAAAGGEPET